MKLIKRLSNATITPQCANSCLHGLQSYAKALVVVVTTCIVSLTPLQYADADGLIPSAQQNGDAGVFGDLIGSPSVESSTGVLATAIDFRLPSARGAVQPTLSLSYRSTLTNFEAGVGWGLGLPVIERKPLSGPPTYEGDERMAFSGRELVQICQVPVTGSCDSAKDETMPAWAAQWRYYRFQVEGTFERFFWSPDGQTWRVQTKGGETLEFGVPLVMQGLVGTGVQLDCTQANQPIYRWNLVRRYDTHDEPKYPNVIVYLWSQSNCDNSRHPVNSYLTDIFDTLNWSDSISFNDFAHHTRPARGRNVRSRA